MRPTLLQVESFGAFFALAGGYFMVPLGTL
jgi:hypothetical protein